MPGILSCSVYLGTPCKVAARKMVEPLFTASIARCIDWSDHCFLFFGTVVTINTAGAELERTRGLPRRFFFRPLLPSNIGFDTVIKFIAVKKA